MIEYINFSGRIIRLYDENIIDGKNIFTTIIGKNGSGKSRLLRELVNNQLRQHVKSEATPSLDFPLQTPPQNIIAISTSPFDRFPIGSSFGLVRGDEFVDEATGFYFYQGLRGLFYSNPSMSYMTRIVGALIRGLTTDSERLSTVLEVLDYLGFNKTIKIRLACVITKPTLKNISTLDGLYEYLSGNRRAGHELKRLLTLLRESPEEYKFEVIDAVNYFLSKFEDGHTEISISETGTLNPRNSLPIEERLATLMECGLLKLREVSLYKKALSKPLRISDASSGEQCVVLTMLGIAARIKDRSLICIDEPEICLHPEWQERYIELLTSTFRSFNSCQFIIATHSPQIISRLENDNCFVLDLNSNKLIEANKLNNRSIDFQLAHVFKAPGYKNEYLMRELLAIFTKMTSGVELTEENHRLIQQAKTLKGSINSTDPVRDLIQLLEDALDGITHE